MGIGAGTLLTAGISTLSGISQANAMGKASVADIQHQGEAAAKSIESAYRSTIFDIYQTESAIADLRLNLRDKMSMGGLEALQVEARLKAAAAETGTSGNSQTEAIYNVKVQNNFRNAAYVREASVAQDNAKIGMVADILNFESAADQLIYGLPSAESAGLKAGAYAGSAFQAGFKSTYNLLGGLFG